MLGLDKVLHPMFCVPGKGLSQAFALMAMQALPVIICSEVTWYLQGC